MKQGSYGERLDYTIQLYRENEVLTNKLAAWVLFIFGALVSGFCILDYAGFLDLGLALGKHLMFCEGILSMACLPIGKLTKFESIWLKNALIVVALIDGSITYFFYPIRALFIYFGPVVCAALYYDRRLVKGLSILSWSIYSILFWSNMYLEMNSGVFKDFHAFQGAQMWLYPREAVYYNYIPATVSFILVYIMCRRIVIKGKEFVHKQAEFSTEKALIEAELNMASAIQLDSMPKKEYKSENGRVEIDAFIRTAKTVGGDFYDYFIIDDNMFFLTADVSDKGMPAALFMMRAKNTVRESVNHRIGLKEAMERTNRILCENNAESMFVTLFIASINIKSGEGEYVNCGHIPPVIIKNGKAQFIENEPELFLGVFDDAKYTSYPLKLEPKDVLLLYTDGITDARNKEDDVFGEERLLSSIDEISSPDAKICSQLVDKVEEFEEQEEQFDDMTLLALRYN